MHVATLPLAEFQAHWQDAQQIQSPHCATTPGDAEKRKRVPAWISILAHQLNSISKRIMNMAAADPGNIVNLIHVDARPAQSFDQGRIVAAAQSRVGLPCRTKLFLHAQVYLHPAAFEPAPASLGEF